MDREKERVWEREKGEIKKNKDNAYKKMTSYNTNDQW